MRLSSQDRCLLNRLAIVSTVVFGGCAQFPAVVGNDGGPPVDCGDGVEALDINQVGAPVHGGFTYTGQLSAGVGHHEGSCSEEQGNEVVLRFTPEIGGDLVVDTFGSDPRVDTVVYVRTQCGASGTEIGCNDDWLSLSCFMSAVEVIDAAVVGVPIFIFVDGYDDSATGEITVTAMARARHQLGARCDPSGVLNRCDEGGVCREGLCEHSNTPMVTSFSVLEIDSSSLRLIVEGSDDDRDVEEADVVLNVPAGEPWTWAGPFTVIEWTGSSFFAWVDLNASEISEIVDLEVSVHDSVSNRSGTSTSTVSPIPVSNAGERCDPDAVLNWCDVGLWCDGESSLCVSNESPTLSSLDVRVFPDAFRVAFSGTDPEGDVLDAEATFINALGEEIEVDGYTDLYAELAWPVEEQTSFVGGFDVLSPPIGATGLRVELLDVAWNESNSMTAQGVEIVEAGEGDACDPRALENICPVSCDPGTSMCVGEDACRQRGCSGSLPALTPGIATSVQLRTLDMGCFLSTCDDTPGPEAIFTLDVPTTSRVVITADKPSSWNLGVILSLRSDCVDVTSELACGDSYYFFPACSWDFAASTVFDRLVLDDVAAGTYFVIADSWSWQGDFELTAELISP